MHTRAVALFRWSGALLVVAPLVGLVQVAQARPPYLAAFEADPMRRADVGGCGTCHVAATGGGARNEFGAAFDAAGREITPLLRASHPRQFAFPAATLLDGSTFHFSDPESKFVVFERERQQVLVDLAALAAPRTVPIPPPENQMSFFVTSTGLATGGKLGGLAGADRLCQALATKAGAGDRTWRAYLSTSFRDTPAVNAGDRIGAGPWYDARGVLVARGPVDLHARTGVPAHALRTEQGEALGQSGMAGVNVFTGTLPDGTAAVGKTCGNWTSAEGEAVARQGADRWNSGQMVGCAPPDTGPGPRLYCFALR